MEYTTPRQDGKLTGQGYFIPGWKPYYKTNALPISGPNGPWGAPDGAYWMMTTPGYQNGTEVDCKDYDGCWQLGY